MGSDQQRHFRVVKNSLRFCTSHNGDCGYWTMRANYKVSWQSAPIWGDEDVVRDAGPLGLMKGSPRDSGWWCSRRDERSRREIVLNRCGN